MYIYYFELWRVLVCLLSTRSSGLLVDTIRNVGRAMPVYAAVGRTMSIQVGFCRRQWDSFEIRKPTRYFTHRHAVKAFYIFVFLFTDSRSRLRLCWRAWTRVYTNKQFNVALKLKQTISRLHRLSKVVPNDFSKILVGSYLWFWLRSTEYRYVRRTMYAVASYNQ